MGAPPGVATIAPHPEGREGTSPATVSLFGEVAVIARRSGTDWYLGCMNGMKPRAFRVALDFLEEGRPYTATVRRVLPELDRRTRTRSIVLQLGDDRDELVAGQVRDESRARYVAIIEKLAGRGVEGIILGCT